MKKQKPNRAKQKNRKFIPGTKAYYRRKYTQFMQREARKNGILSPRCLARSVGLFVGQVTDDISAANAAKNWKAYVEAAVNHPYQFRAMLNPQKRIPKRVIRKLEGGAE